MTQQTHSVERTSPIGQKFIGRCVNCGKEGLTIFAAGEDCPNPKKVNSDQTLINAIKGNKQ